MNRNNPLSKPRTAPFPAPLSAPLSALIPRSLALFLILYQFRLLAKDLADTPLFASLLAAAFVLGFFMGAVKSRAAALIVLALFPWALRLLLSLPRFFSTFSTTVESAVFWDSILLHLDRNYFAALIPFYWASFSTFFASQSRRFLRAEIIASDLLLALIFTLARTQDIEAYRMPVFMIALFTGAAFSQLIAFIFSASAELKTRIDEKLAAVAVVLVLAIIGGILLLRPSQEQAVEKGGGLLQPKLFKFDFSQMLRLESEISMTDDLEFIVKKEPDDEHILLRRYILSGYKKGQGFFRDEIVDEKTQMAALPNSALTLKTEPVGDGKLINQEYYIVNFDGSALIAMNQAAKITPFESWDATSFNSAYAVQSVVSDALPFELTDAVKGALTPQKLDLSAEEYALYTEYGADERLKAFAEEITKGKSNYFDKLEAIYERLKRGEYLYSLKPGIAPDGDQLSYFLFESKKGYCSYYAFAFCLLARSLGIPARVAAGFFIDPDGNTFDYYPVRADMAHAWVEVRFPGYGWIEFDPTSEILAPDEDFRLSQGVDPGLFSRLMKEILENHSRLRPKQGAEDAENPLGMANLVRQTLKIIRKYWIAALVLVLAAVFVFMRTRFLLAGLFARDTRKKAAALWRHTRLRLQLAGYKREMREDFEAEWAGSLDSGFAGRGGSGANSMTHGGPHGGAQISGQGAKQDFAARQGAKQGVAAKQDVKQDVAAGQKVKQSVAMEQDFAARQGAKQGVAATQDVKQGVAAGQNVKQSVAIEQGFAAMADLYQSYAAARFAPRFGEERYRAMQSQYRLFSADYRQKVPLIRRIFAWVLPPLAASLRGKARASRLLVVLALLSLAANGGYAQTTGQSPDPAANGAEAGAEIARANALYNTAQRAADAENWERAIELYLQGEIAFPGDPRFSLSLGDLYYGRRLYSLSLDQYRITDRLVPDNTGVLYKLYEAASHLNKDAESAGYLERVLALDPLDHGAITGLGWTYFKLHRLDEGARLLENALDHFKNDIDLQMTLATIYSDMFRYDDSRKQYLASIKGAEGFGGGIFAAIAHYNLSILESRFYHYDLAFKETQASLDSFNRASGHLARGEILLRRLDFKQGIADYEAAYETDTSPLSKLNLADSFQSASRLDQALAYALECLKAGDHSWMTSYGTDPVQYRRDIHEILYKTYLGLANTESFAVPVSVWAKIKSLCRGISYRFKGTVHRLLFKKYALSSADAYDYINGQPHLDALHLYEEAFKRYPRRALFYVRTGAAQETPIIPDSAPAYTFEEGNLLNSRETLAAALAGFDPVWERDRIAEALTSLAKLKNGSDSAEKLFALNRGALRQNGIRLPALVVINADAAKKYQKPLLKAVRKIGFVPSTEASRFRLTLALRGAGIGGDSADGAVAGGGVIADIELFDGNKGVAILRRSIAIPSGSKADIGAFANALGEMIFTE